MEHRCGTRRQIDTGVIVDCRPNGLIHGRIRNISVGGLFVKMRPMPGLASDRVKVVFVRRERGVSRIYRLPAVVMRWSREGAGLMFSELTPNAFYALLAILLAEEQRHRERAARSGAVTRGSSRGSWFNK
ncbi:hypothetical protein SVA_2297 [Sulfurifustis variabilis]|uniref:PilZ domain-containing protein n=1 Tax=Sulfurifustis variabilis TaxID=1675686 RepID=A0A1B4VE17_9GAMM|nr:PilZ domain-containing protein [Sulfurifustis variabilis]BAU48847.1 hypothetical protein SVA_2297 [Sulfurifustis variabilis]